MAAERNMPVCCDRLVSYCGEHKKCKPLLMLHPQSFRKDRKYVLTTRLAEPWAKYYAFGVGPGSNLIMIWQAPRIQSNFDPAPITSEYEVIK